MREPVRDRGRLSHMIDAIDCILRNTQSMGFEDLHRNELEFYGIVKSIEIVGEAAYRLSKMFKERYPKTPWDGIVKMRHILVHDYYQVDDKEVWNVIQDDLPVLRQQIMEYISTVDWDEWESQTFIM